MGKITIRLKKLLILAFIAAMLSPTLAALLGFGAVLPIEENRVRSHFPSAAELKQEFQTTGNLYPAIERWYNDTFGLRDLLIRTKHQLDYSLFRYNPDLYFIRGNYLVYRNVVAAEQIDNETMDPELAEEIVRAWEEVGKVLSDRGIAFRFFFAPQKNEILTGESAVIPIKRPEPNAFLRFETRLADSRVGENYISVLEPLRKQNQTAPVFYRSDFHWNDWGAAVAFVEVFNSYACEQGLDPLFTLDEFPTVPIEDFHGGQVNNLSLLSQTHYDEITVQKPESGLLPYEDLPSGLRHWNNSGQNRLDGAVLFIGDSYTPPALENLGPFVRLFEDTYFCHWDYSSGVLSNLPEDTRLIIFEKTESGISFSLDAVKNLLSDTP